jgi:hypothetical protein
MRRQQEIIEMNEREIKPTDETTSADENNQVESAEKTSKPLFARLVGKQLKVRTALRGGFTKRCADYG